MPRRCGERSGQPSTSASADLGDVKKKDQGFLDGQVSQCDEEAGSYRRLGAEEAVRHRLVGREDLRRMRQRRRHKEAQVVPLSRVEGGQTPDAGCGEEMMGAQGPNVEGRNFGTCLSDEHWSGERPCLEEKKRWSGRTKPLVENVFSVVGGEAVKRKKG